MSTPINSVQHFRSRCPGRKAARILGAGPGRLAVVLVSLMIGGVVCQAASAAPLPAVKEQCGAEIRSLCLRPWRMTPGSIADCVAENRSDLSPICQTFWDDAHRCQLEMQSVCGGLFPLTIKSCLSSSRAQFSPFCQDVLDLD